MKSAGFGGAQRRRRISSALLRDIGAVDHLGPICVGEVDVGGLLGAPFGLDGLAEVQIELAIDDGERLGVDHWLVAARQAEGAIAAILRQIAGWFGDEGVAVGFNAEAIGRAVVFGSHVRAPRRGAAGGEIGHHIMAGRRRTVLLA